MNPNRTSWILTVLQELEGVSVSAGSTTSGNENIYTRTYIYIYIYIYIYVFKASRPSWFAWLVCDLCEFLVYGHRGYPSTSRAGFRSVPIKIFIGGHGCEIVTMDNNCYVALGVMKQTRVGWQHLWSPSPQEHCDSIVPRSCPRHGFHTHILFAWPHNA